MKKTGSLAALQNLTLQLPKEIIRRARVLAAQKGTSVSRLLARTLEDLVADEEAYDAARRRALDRMKVGFHLGGKVRVSREELHAR